MNPLPNIDVLIASIPGAELRLVGELLPFLSAHIEHCVLCPRCTGEAGVVDMDCAGCADEDGFSTGYVERRVCMEGECEACDRLDSLVQPGCDIDDGGFGFSPCSACGGDDFHVDDCAYVVYPEAA